MSRFGNLEFEADASRSHGETRVEHDANYWGLEAERAFNRAEFETALRFFARVLEFNPDQVSAWTGQVRALIELGEFREAKVWADKALERFPTAPELLAAKGVALGRLGDVDSALAFSDASLEERGDTAYIWLARGDVLLARKEKLADHCFERARSLAAGAWWVTWLAARVRYYYGQFAAALKQAQQAAAQDAGQFVVWVLLGDCQLALGLSDAARVSWTQGQQLEPGSRSLTERLLALRQRSWLQKGWGKLRGLLHS
ncbi:MAG TPA: tetratricopeptide repeat protein [Verrucomicrobiota bacterium]|nr:hypothetical protein [Verrucomicrobiales bacterium]HRI13735.1 tetratricopeptide repeat protein [Verrucomicrobiota bacterium]